MQGVLTVISGFSGAGKGTIVKKLVEKYTDYNLSISMTSRKPREGEREGVDYFYTDRESFEKAIADGMLIEYNEYNGNYYGTPRKYVEDKLNSGSNVLLEIEVNGAKNIKRLFPDSVIIFITPPTADELEMRLRKRGTENEETIMKRMAISARESAEIANYDYIVVNDDLYKCVEDIRHITESAMDQPHRMTEFITGLQNQLAKYAQ